MDASRMSVRSKKLLFVATEDWFVRSHFLPMVERSLAEGYEVVIAAGGTGEGLEGARFIQVPFARGSLRPADLVREVSALRDILRQERPDIAHAIALKPIALLLLTEGARARAFAVTGLGYLAIGGKWWTRVALGVLSRALRSAVSRTRAVLLVENHTDRRWVENGAPLSEEKVVLLPGAGVDPNHFAPMPEPDGPIVVGVVARLIRSKGVDLVVEAVQRLRRAGEEIELRIAGAADPDNPERAFDQEIARWREASGVTLLGRVTDIAGFWARAHIACLASRGGEGLPRSLLEAAACGRPVVTTSVPGCADFIQPGQTGIVVAPDDAAALADALQTLCQDAALRRRMGEAGRARVLSGYTTQHVADVVADAWARLCA
jgi:glycosyltransferase involved in cell wall biosynthesis